MLFIAVLIALGILFLWSRERARDRQRMFDRCSGHRWVYHSLYREGRVWNRICTFCRKHETHWSDTQHPNWPPSGARIRRDESMPDEAWREARAELKRLLDERGSREKTGVPSSDDSDRRAS